MGIPTTRSSNGKGQGKGSGSYTRSGRGYSRSRSSATSNSTKKEQQSTGQIKFQLHGQKTRQTATYTKVLENLIVKIQNTFERPISLVRSIREKTKHAPDEPKRVRVKIEGTDVEKEDKVFLQSTKDIQYTQEYNTWQKVNGKFAEDWTKVYGLIYGTYCTSEMKAAIKEHPDFEIEIRDEPLKVLEVISTLMYTPVRARYPFSTLAETISSLFNLRQSQDEKLVDFIERFTQEKQLVRTQLGKRFLDVFVGNTIEYNASTDADEQAEMKNDAFDQFMAILFLRASD